MIWNPNEDVSKCVGNAEADFLTNPQFFKTNSLLSVDKAADVANEFLKK